MLFIKFVFQYIDIYIFLIYENRQLSIKLPKCDSSVECACRFNSFDYASHLQRISFGIIIKPRTREREKDDDTEERSAKEQDRRLYR